MFKTSSFGLGWAVTRMDSDRSGPGPGGGGVTRRRAGEAWVESEWFGTGAATWVTVSDISADGGLGRSPPYTTCGAGRAGGTHYGPTRIHRADYRPRHGRCLNSNSA